jgi:ribose transport system ATP-binding protein
VRNVSKSFGVTRANRDITLDIERGCVHGFAGENGSGKSTLASMICGIQKPDAGSFLKDGEPYAPKNSMEAADRRVSMVIQELGVVGALSPALNMYLGHTSRFGRLGFVNMKKMELAAAQQFEKWGLPRVPLHGFASELAIEQRKLLELARALSCDPDFLVLDEISQALSQDNREMLYRFIKRFADEGKTILLITHDLEEMVEICDTVSVLRDGALIDTRNIAGTSVNDIKRMMIGREAETGYHRGDAGESFGDEVVLEVRNLSAPGMISGVSFDLHRGEILGVCGLSDGGIHELGFAMFGMADGMEGSIVHKPTGRRIRRSSDVVCTGGAYLAKDRDAFGLMLDASIHHNLCVPSGGELSSRFAYLSPSRLRELSDRVTGIFDIRCKHLRQPVRSLSGGNKQKVNLSRWLIKDLKYIILDCPTRGVDIGVKSGIYRILSEAKKNGISILLITDELTEAVGMADRILVMKDHKQSAILSRAGDFTNEKIIEVML